MQEHIFNSSLGKLALSVEDGAIHALHFAGQDAAAKGEADAAAGADPLVQEAQRQLLEYLDGKRKRFDLKLAPHGTEFQVRVWQALLDIPYGETRSYGDIARAAGSPKGARAVGMACNRNPIAIIIPCHRVIGGDGGLTGYAGGPLIKDKLLKLEGDQFSLL